MKQQMNKTERYFYCITAVILITIVSYNAVRTKTVEVTNTEIVEIEVIKEVEVEKQPYEERKVMINKNISTIDAMGIRGLGMYIDAEWRGQVEQAQLERTSAHLNKNPDGSVNAVLKRADQQ